MSRRSTRDTGSANFGIQMHDNSRLKAENVAVGDHAQIVASRSSESMDELLDFLRREIERLPDDQAHVKNELEAFRGALESESQKTKPSKPFWEINSKGLVEAAKAVATMAPSILQTAEKLARWFAGLNI